MKKPTFLHGALAGLLTTAPLIALLYLVHRAVGLSFVPFAVFEWVRDRLPAGFLNIGIDAMVKVLTALGLSVRTASKPAEIIMVLGTFLVAGAVAGALFFSFLRRNRTPRGSRAGLVLGAVFGLPLAVVVALVHRAPAVALAASVLWSLAALVGWGYAQGWIFDRLSGLLIVEEAAAADTAAVKRIDRRKFLVSLGAASATITVLGAGLGRVLAIRVQGKGGGLAGGSIAKEGGRSEEAVLPNADDPLEPAPGTRPEYTPLRDHYRIDINLSPPQIDGAGWSLPIVGLVEKPVTLTLEDLMTKYEPMHQFVTLSCISNEIGGDLIGTTRWTGVSLRKILDEVGVKEEAKFLDLESIDGFHETVPLDLIRKDERIMLAYAWDGKLLETKHGFPLRIYIPDRYGMKQPKWITRATLAADFHPGYWVERGWDREASARATSVIDTVAVEDILTADSGERLVPVGGIAWAGARGISKVEVKVDDGPWVESGLRRPLSATTWATWRYDWPFKAGSHTFFVRCREGDGTAQIETPAGTFPSGATGIHMMRKKL